MKNLFQIFFCSIILIASASTVKANTYRISILTCAQGEDLYATFGHSAIRSLNSENSLGDELIDVQNCIHCFAINDSQDCRY